MQRYHDAQRAAEHLHRLARIDAEARELPDRMIPTRSHSSRAIGSPMRVRVAKMHGSVAAT